MLSTVGEGASVSNEEGSGPVYTAKGQKQKSRLQGRLRTTSSKTTSYGYQGKRRNLRDHTIARSQSMSLRNLQQELTVKQKLRKYLAVSTVGLGLDLMNCILSISSVIVYVAETYRDIAAVAGTMFMNFELVTSLFFLVDLLLRFSLSGHHIYFWFKWESLVDIFTILPIFFAYEWTTGQTDPDLFGGDQSSLQFMRAIRILKILRIVRIHRMFAYLESEISQQIFKMGLTVVSMLVLFTGFVHMSENMSENARVRRMEESLVGSAEDGKIPFHDMFYFIVISLTTVGYGDITVYSLTGRMFVTIMMAIMFVVVPSQTNELLSLLSNRSEYERRVFYGSKDTRHILVCGEISENSAVFFEEMFHEDHGRDAYELKAVILGANKPPRCIEKLIENPVFFGQIVYLQGSAMSWDDLHRAAAESAEACFILTDKFSRNPDEVDAATILRAMAIKRYNMLAKEVEATSHLKLAEAKMRMCIQLLKPENREHFTTSKVFRNLGDDTRFHNVRQDHVLCIDEIKMNILAKSCLCPGVCALISNLVSSKDAPEEINDAWQDEYCDGCSYEIYSITLGVDFEGLSFGEAALQVYNKLEVTLFAIEIRPRDLGTRIVIYPSDFIIPNVVEYDLHAYCIARDRKEALRVTDCLAPSYSEWGVEGGGDDPVVSKVLRSVAETMTGSIRNYSTKSNKNVLRVMKKAKQEDAEEATPITSTIHRFKSKWQMIFQNRKRSHDDLMDLKANELDFMSLRHMYHLLPTMVPFQDVIIRDVHEIPMAEQRDLIIICGDMTNIYYMLLSLRSRHLDIISTVVILSPIRPTVKEWNKYAHTKAAFFPQLYYIEGSGLDREDLSRAGIGKAKSAVVLANEQRHELDPNHKSERNAVIDSDTIFMVQAILRENPDVNVVAELANPSNIPFLNPSSSTFHLQTSKDTYLEPSFAAGQVYTATILDTLLCQTFYNPRVITVIEQLVSSEDPVKARRWNERIKKASAHQLDNLPKESHLFQIPVPKTFCGKRYGPMLQYLVREKHMLPIGLQRGIWGKLGQGPHGNSALRNVIPNLHYLSTCQRMPYCYLNPPHDARVEKCDSVYVLCQRQPKMKRDMVEIAMQAKQQKRRKTKQDLRDQRSGMDGLQPIQVLRRQTLLLEKQRLPPGSLSPMLNGEAGGSIADMLASGNMKKKRMHLVSSLKEEESTGPELKDSKNEEGEAEIIKEAPSESSKASGPRLAPSDSKAKLTEVLNGIQRRSSKALLQASDDAVERLLQSLTSGEGKDISGSIDDLRGALKDAVEQRERERARMIDEAMKEFSI